MMTDSIELNRAGNRLLAARRYDDAERVFRELVRQDPESPAGYVGLAKIMDRRQRFAEIIHEIEPAAVRFRTPQLLRIVADTYRVLVSRGEKHLTDRAIALHEIYHDIKNDPVTLYYLGMLYVQEKCDYEAALRCFEKSWELDPKSRLAYEGVVFSLRRLFRKEDIEAVKQLWRERNEGEEPPRMRGE